MLKQPEPARHKTTRPEITLLFRAAKLVLEETPKAISPFGGWGSYIAFLGQIGFAAQVQKHLPFAEPTSNNAIPLAHGLTAFPTSVAVGARRFAHAEWLRAARALHALLDLARFPSDDTIRNFFLRFGQADIVTFWRPLGRALLLLLRCPAPGFSLELDSTVFGRKGQQEGAKKGFKPRRKGCKSHHPLLAVLAEAQFFLHGWLRGGNTGAARGVVPFLQEALALLPEGMGLRTVCADSGFYDQALLEFLEGRQLPYIVVARLTSTLKRHCAGIKDWTVMDEDHAAGEFTVKLFGWSKERRFVVVRERVRETEAAVGRRLIDEPGYTFRVWVTHRDDQMNAVTYILGAMQQGDPKTAGELLPLVLSLSCTFDNEGLEHQQDEGEPVVAAQGGGQAFVISRQAPKTGSPAKGPFHPPSSRQQHESFLGFLQLHRCGASSFINVKYGTQKSHSSSVTSLG